MEIMEFEPISSTVTVLRMSDRAINERTKRNRLEFEARCAVADVHSPCEHETTRWFKER